MPPDPRPPTSDTNRLLAALAPADLAHVLEASEMVELAYAAVLYSPLERMRDVYFPTSGFLSLMLPLARTVSLQVGMIGNEGMFGAPLALGVDVSRALAVVRGAGWAWRLGATAFEYELDRSPSLRRAVHRYVCVQLGQLAQAAACTRFHVVEARLARGLLGMLDRMQTSAFHVTQESLAAMLGVRRAGVTKAASALQVRHLIQYTRGHLTVLDRIGLEGAACMCYKEDRNCYDRILGKSAEPLHIRPAVSGATALSIIKDPN